MTVERDHLPELHAWLRAARPATIALLLTELRQFLDERGVPSARLLDDIRDDFQVVVRLATAVDRAICGASCPRCPAVGTCVACGAYHPVLRHTYAFLDELDRREASD